MCDGSYQPIETVQAGQWVLARDASTGEFACKEVVDPYANPDRSIIVLELQAEDGTIEAIETTDNHPFFVADRGWTRVDELSIGDLIPSADGTMLTLVSALWTHRIETVYNFGVEGLHTYFVGESEAWVHNCLRDRVSKISLPSDKSHLPERGVQRAGFSNSAEVDMALTTLKREIKSGKPSFDHYLVDTNYADRVLVPFGDGYAVIQYSSKGGVPKTTLPAGVGDNARYVRRGLDE